MADYISREAAWNGIYNCPTKTDADGYIWVRTKDVAHMIDEIPAADVREVKRGKWIYNEAPVLGNPYGSYRCTACLQAQDHKSNYCPNCGAMMEES